MYQGILQVGVAFLQIERNNWSGALKMFRRGLPRLRTLPPICQGVDIAAFRSVAEQIHWEITAIGAERLHEFDRATFPRIALVE
jgi:predicted metal-dependent hydrolase